MTGAPRANTGTATTALPTISILLPNHNNACFIDNALRALAAQTRPADEILVIEDARPMIALL
jgi:hypothetical protein